MMKTLILGVDKNDYLCESVDVGSSASPSSSSGSKDEMSSTLNSSGTPVAPSADNGGAAERIDMGYRIRKALESISMGASAETLTRSCARKSHSAQAESPSKSSSSCETEP